MCDLFLRLVCLYCVSSCDCVLWSLPLCVLFRLPLPFPVNYGNYFNQCKFEDNWVVESEGGENVAIIINALLNSSQSNHRCGPRIVYMLDYHIS